MASLIPMKKYVDVSSALVRRQTGEDVGMHTRVFTQSASISSPDGEASLKTFTGVSGVLDFFGESSEEYRFSLVYFGTKHRVDQSPPSKIQFQKWRSVSSQGVFTGGAHSDLVTLQAITAGQMNVNFNGAGDTTITGIDLSSITSFADIPAVLSPLVQAVPGLSSASVEYDSILQRVIVRTGVLGSGQTMSIGAGPVDDASNALGLDSGGFVDGSDSKTPVQAITDSIAVDDKFFGVGFMPDAALSNSDISDVAVFLNGKPNNLGFIYGESRPNDATLDPLLDLISDTGGVFIVKDQPGEHHLAAMLGAVSNTNYSKASITKEVIFDQSSGITTSVESEAEATSLDGKRVNYYGKHQRLGIRNFLAPGKLQGGANDIDSMGVYASNEKLKRDVIIALDKKMLQGRPIPLNSQGISTVKSIISDVAREAIRSGVISLGVPIDAESDRQEIISIVDDDAAPDIIISNGFYVNVEISNSDANTIVYDLIYAASDKVRKVIGTHYVYSQG
jgi:hypothetical protein